MKYKKMMLVMLLLLAILTIGAVSASEHSDENLTVSPEAEFVQASDSDDISSQVDVDELSADEREKTNYEIKIPEYVMAGDTEDDDIMTQSMMESCCIHYTFKDYDVTGNLSIMIDNHTYYTGQLNDELYSRDNYFALNYLDLAYGSHFVQVKYSGDEKYLPFNVSGYYDYCYLKMGTSQVDIDSTSVDVIFSLNATGTLQVIIDDKLYTTIEDVYSARYSEWDNSYSSRLYISLDDDLTYGNHKYKLVYSNGNYPDMTVEGNFTADYIFSVYNWDLEQNNTFYLGEKVEVGIKIPDDKGSIVLNLNGKDYPVEITEEFYFYYILPEFDYGVNNLTFTYIHSKYPSKQLNFTVNASSRISHDYGNVFYNAGVSNVTLILPSNANGNLSIYKKGDYNYEIHDYDEVLYKTVALVNGRASICIDDLSIGSHGLTAVYTGTDYDMENDTWYFTVFPNVIYPEEMYYQSSQNVTVEVPEDSTGNITISIHEREGDEYSYTRGELISVLFNDTAKGRFSVEIPQLQADTYYLVVEYSEDDNLVTSKEYILKVRDENPNWEMNIEIPDKLEIIFDDDNYLEYAYWPTLGYFDGIFRLYIDDELVDSTGYYAADSIYDYSDLTAGEHSWRVEFTNDSYFNPTSASGKFNITKNFDDVIIKIYDFNYDDPEDYFVEIYAPMNAKGNVKVMVENQTVFDDSITKLLDADDEFKVYVGDVNYSWQKKYYTIKVVYEGDDYGTFNSTATVEADYYGGSTDFDSDYSYSDEEDPITVLSNDIFWLYDSPAAGKLIVFVDNINVYNASVSVGGNVYITSEELGIDGESSPYHITVIFNTTEGEEFTLEDFNAYYDTSGSQKPYIAIYSEIYRDQIAPLVYIYDDNSVNGTVRVYIDGKKYYDKEFDGTRNSLNIMPSHLDGVDVFDEDFLGNHTVKVTYNNFTEESNVTFIFEPYLYISYNVPAGEVSYVVFYAPGNFTGNISLYNAVYNETADKGEIGSLILKYAISDSAREIPLPKLTKGNHLFYVNYTIDGKSDAGFFGVTAVENSEDFTSSISSSQIDEGGSLSITVTGPKMGWIDFYVDKEHVTVYSLVNGTVKHTFSDLTAGTHVISLSYDGEDYNDVFYTKEFLVTVSGSSSNPKLVDNSVDSSDTRIYGELTLTDIATGEVFKRNITGDLIKSSMTNPGNYTSNATAIMNQLLSLAQSLAGDKTVTVKTQDVTKSALSRYDNRQYNWIDPPGYTEIGGDYGTKWIVNVTLIAEFASETINMANVKVALSQNTFTYNTKVQKPTVTLTNGAVLKEGVDYTLQWSSASPVNAGTYSLTVTGTGAYTGTSKVTFVINKAANPLAVKAKTVKVKFSKLKKKAQTLAVSKVVKFTKKGQGTLTYAKASGNKKITINKKTGKVTIKKSLKKGTYKVKVKIKANGNANYLASAFKTVTFKIKVN